MKKLITILYFQLGVNVVGLPDIISHYLGKYFIHKSQFHK